MKRVILLIATNIAVMLVLSIVVSVLGLVGNIIFSLNGTYPGMN